MNYLYIFIRYLCFVDGEEPTQDPLRQHHQVFIKLHHQFLVRKRHGVRLTDDDESRWEQILGNS